MAANDEQLIMEGARHFSRYKDVRDRAFACETARKHQLREIQRLKGEIAIQQEAHSLEKKRMNQIAAEEKKVVEALRSSGRILLSNEIDIVAVQRLRYVEKVRPAIYCLTPALVADLRNMGYAAYIYPPPTQNGENGSGETGESGSGENGTGETGENGTGENGTENVEESGNEESVNHMEEDENSVDGGNSSENVEESGNDDSDG